MAVEFSLLASSESQPGKVEPLVSVIITSLNRPEFLRTACASVLRGSYKNIEVFICDDASDNQEARDAPRALALSDERIEIIQNGVRLGQFRSIAQAMARMRGKYFAILNDDDTWEVSFLAKLVPPLERDRELVASFCDHWLIDADGQIDMAATDRLTAQCQRADLAPGRHEDSGNLAFGLSAFPTVVASFFRTSRLGLESYLNARMDTIGFYDLWLQVCLLRDRAPVWFEPERCSSYRLHTGQLSAQRSNALARAKAWILEEALNGGRFAKSEQSILHQLARSHHAVGVNYHRQGRLRLARNYLWRACLIAPRWRAVSGLVLTLGVWPIRVRERLVRS
jgi:glycosyltransferase involved in cell wall biosynthesis